MSSLDRSSLDGVVTRRGRQYVVVPTAPPECAVIRPTPPAPDPQRSPGGADWSRRSILQAAAAACAAASLVSACGGDEPEQPDILEAPAERARRDAESIAAAIAVYPDRADSLAVLAAHRRAHADALTAEIERLNPVTTTNATEPAPPAVAPPSLDEIRAGLIAAADEAGGLVPAAAGYRCGLLGSIAASCRSQVAVALP